MLGRLSAALVGAALAVAVVPSHASAAPPPNDGPAAAGAFAPYTAENGVPHEQEAIAELAEATPDSGTPACLGPLSFARTVWYRVPEQPGPQLVTVEASGRTLDVIDLAAFVQPLQSVPPTPPPALQTREPNACYGLGAGGSDAAEEPTSGLTLRVPAQQAVLVQVGRRGAVGSVDDERATLSLDVQVEADVGRPSGDRATAAPAIRGDRANAVDLAGATVTEEDPAEPACPSLGTVWRRVEPGRSGKRLIRVAGSRATTLTVFSGKRPTADNALDCVNREGRGSLQMVVPARRGRPLWIRIGTEGALDAAEASLEVLDGAHQTVIDGGPGGFDPTPGGPAGGFPASCLRSRADRARVSGPSLRGPAKALNRFRRIPFSLLVRGASVCDAQISLFGPRNRLYAQGRVLRLTGRRVVRLPRLRTIVKGRYRLRVQGVSPVGRRVTIRGSVRGRLR
jgi:hypothetical protein